MKNKIIGREKEVELFKRLTSSKQAEFLAIFGRRRVGKTFLVRQFFSQKNYKYFEVTGLKDGTREEQLQIFKNALNIAFYPNIKLADFRNWIEALEQLTTAVESQQREQKIILFFDELPWLATQKSGLLQAIDHYWNTRWSKIENLLFIACGSAASWMLDNLIYAKGGLHNRVTAKIGLQPFTLMEASQYLFSLGFKYSNKQVLQIYMVMGGIPHYLRWLNKELSPNQNINQVCFNPDGGLFKEFEVLYSSLFSQSHFHLDLIKFIAKYKKGVSREEIIRKLPGVKSGGVLTKRLKELEEAGFIASFVPFGHMSKDIFFRIIDEYTLFYLHWIHPVKRKLKLLRGEAQYWENILHLASYNAWAGLAFEAVCLKHIDYVIKALNLQSLVIGAGSWRYVSSPHNKNEQSGAQIDLLIERKDNILDLCEIKYNSKQFIIDKQYTKILKNRMEVFKAKSKTKMDLRLIFITVNGVKHNSYYAEIITKDIEADVFFK